MATRICDRRPLSIGIALVLLSAGLMGGAALAAEAKKKATAPSEVKSAPLQKVPSLSVPARQKTPPPQGLKPPAVIQMGGADLVGRVSGPDTWKAGETKQLELEARNAAKSGGATGSGPLAGVVLLTRQPPAGGAGMAGQLPDALQRKKVKFARTPAAGRKESATASVSVPAETAPGRYHWCLVLDPKNAVPEADEGNNVACHAVQVSDANSLAQKLDGKLTPRVGGLAAQQQPSLADQIERPPDLGSGPRVLLADDDPPPMLGAEIREGLGRSAPPGLRPSIDDPGSPRSAVLSAAIRQKLQAPNIEVFEAETAECVEPDPARPLLRYRVRARTDGPRIARIEINALWEHVCAASGGSRLCAETQNPDKVRLIYSWDAPPSDPAEAANRFGIPDDDASSSTFAYVLVVTDTTGYRQSRRIGFDYRVPMPELGEFSRRDGAQEFALAFTGPGGLRDIVATADDGTRASGVMEQRGGALIFNWNASLCDHGSYSVSFTHYSHATGCGRETRTYNRRINASQFADWCRAAAPPPPEPEPEPERDSTWEVDCACRNAYGETTRARIRTCAAPPEIPAYRNGLNLQCGLLGAQLSRYSTRGHISCVAINGTESLISRDSCPGAGFFEVVD
jgi:hypothetical protein